MLARHKIDKDGKPKIEIYTVLDSNPLKKNIKYYIDRGQDFRKGENDGSN